MTLRHAASALAALAVGLLPAAPARAGGTWLSPVRDSYTSGEDVTIVGYSSGTGSGGPVEQGPFYGWLRVVPSEAYRDPPDGVWPFVHPSDLRVGEVAIDRTRRLDWATYRLELSFHLPSTLADGSYEIVVCNDPCRTSFGDVIGATVYVGVDPPEPLTREWPLDDPAIAQLDDDALVYAPGWPGYTLTAAQIRRGETAPGPAPVDQQAAQETAEARLDAGAAQPDRDPAAAPEPAARPDVELAAQDDGGGSAARPLLYAAGAVALAAGYVGLRRAGPRRKQVHVGPVAQGGPGGQPASRPARWPGRVVRL